MSWEEVFERFNNELSDKSLFVTAPDLADWLKDNYEVKEKS